MRKALTMLCLVALFAGVAGSLAAAEESTWTGQVLDLACYAAHGKADADHANCAKNCVKGGQPMGLLTDDGTVYLLAADHGDNSAFEAAKDLAGSKADISGSVAERGGMKVITVTGAKAAS